MALLRGRVRWGAGANFVLIRVVDGGDQCWSLTDILLFLHHTAQSLMVGISPKILEFTTPPATLALFQISVGPCQHQRWELKEVKQ